MPTEHQADGTATRVAWLSPDEQEAWRVYIRLAKMLLRQLDRDLHPFGLTTNDYEILLALSEAPGHRLRMTELADLTAQSRSRLSHQITRMEDKELVRRDSCAGDKRGTVAVITQRGLATVDRVAPRHVASVRRHFVDQMPAPQLATVASTLKPVLDRLGRVRDRD